MCLFFVVVTMSCDQEPLFWDIAHEYPPIRPTIGGRPTAIVDTGIDGGGGTLYVSNGKKVYKYNIANAARPFWEEMEYQPGNQTKDLAAVGAKLFALDWDGTIKTSSGGAWTLLKTIKNAENLFGAGSYLFSTAIEPGKSPGLPGSYTIMCMDDAGALLSEISNTGLLMSAVDLGGTIFLGTMGNGVYSGGGPVFAQDAVNFGVNDTIIGLTVFDSELFAVTPTKIIVRGKGEIASGNFTGAIAGWTHTAKGGAVERLILVGLRRYGGSFGYGYREIQLDSANAPLSGLTIPGEETVSSVTKGSQFISAIGKSALNNFYILNTFSKRADGDDKPIIFACTMKSGVWSYRTRNGTPQWNGEDKTGF